MVHNDKIPFGASSDEVLLHIWSALEDGSKSGSSYNLLQLATVDEGNKPAVRTIVLRQFRRQPEQLLFVTEASSEKLRHIQANNEVSLLGYDPGTWTQIRLSGRASVPMEEEERLSQWKMLSSRTRRSFLPRDACTRAVDQAFEEVIICDNQGSVPPTSFALVKVILHTAELLDVSEEEHVQYNFQQADGRWRGERSRA